MTPAEIKELARLILAVSRDNAKHYYSFKDTEGELAAMKLASACIVTGQMAVDSIFKNIGITKSERDEFFNNESKRL